MSSLVYIFTGLYTEDNKPQYKPQYKAFPSIFFDNLFQFYLYNHTPLVHVYLLTERVYIDHVVAEFATMDVDDSVRPFFHVIAIEDLDPVTLHFDATPFRTPFFYAAFKRFAILYSFMEQFNQNNVFHIEYDVMLYCNLTHINSRLEANGMIDRLVVVRDAPTRAIGSIVFSYASKQILDFLHFTHDVLTYQSVSHINEMDLLGMYQDAYSFPHFLTDSHITDMGFFDGACMGQYLGGIDPRNIRGGIPNRFINPSIGFVNETSTLKPNTVSITVNRRVVDMERPLYKSWVINGTIPIHALHIHSKMLYRFSSVFEFDYPDIITGDRIFDKCDFVVCSPQNYAFHRGLSQLMCRIIIVQNGCDVDAINSAFMEVNETRGVVRVGVYTHTDYVLSMILPYIDPSIRLTLYYHNSDHALSSTDTILNIPCVEKIYSQNLNFFHDKVHLLPIGIANAMWPHGDLMVLFEEMVSGYWRKKTKNFYANINTATFPYRKHVMDILLTHRFSRYTETKSFPAYIKELAIHRFALCVRGNGIDTHRLWECLYLGVVPVVINNKHTHCENYISHLKRLKIPLYEITHFTEFVKSKDDTIFGEDLYHSVMMGAGDYKERLRVGWYFQN